MRLALALFAACSLFVVALQVAGGVHSTVLAEPASSPTAEPSTNPEPGDSPCRSGGPDEGDDDASEGSDTEEDDAPRSKTANAADDEDGDEEVEDDDCPSDCGDQTAPGAYLFDLPDWGGECFYFKHTVPNLGGFDNRASSLRIVGSFEVYGCLNPYFGEPCGGAVITDASQILNIEGDFDNSLSSVNIKPWVDACIEMTDSGVYMYSGANYTGTCVFYRTDSPHLGAVPPYYANDVFASFKLIGFPQVELCSEDNYNGVCKTFSADDPDLSNDNLYFGEYNSQNVTSLRFPVQGVSAPTSTPAPTPPPTTAPVEVSDANCDGAINGNDVLAILSYASGSGKGCTGSNHSGDADCNGRIDAADAERILTLMAGITSASC